jgi:phage FluMu protein Com
VIDFGRLKLDSNFQADHLIMFVKCPCQHCNGHIEFDVSYAGMSVKCPHCFETAKLFVPEIPLAKETNVATHHVANIEDEAWMNDPMTEKQKAMFVLYGITLKEGLTKGEAAKLIDNAIQSGIKPNKENQLMGSELFGKIRLNEIVEEITEAIKIISDETVTITKLKETKKSVKESVKSLTDIIDRRIENKQEENREVRYQKTSQWLKEHGL